MTARHRRLWLRSLAVAIALLFAAGEVLARGGRGGGGGGRGGGSHRGGSMSRQHIDRGGPASRGLGSAKRAQTQPSRSQLGGGGSSRLGEGSRGRARDETGNRAGDRASTRDDLQGRTDRVQDRESDRSQRQEDRQDRLDQAREDRQDFWGDQIEEVDWNEVDWDEVDVWESDEFEWNSGAWMALGVGTALTLGAWNTMVEQPGCSLEQVEVEGVNYYKCGNTWYIEAWTGDDVHYVATNPPPGF